MNAFINKKKKRSKEKYKDKEKKMKNKEELKKIEESKSLKELNNWDNFSLNDNGIITKYEPIEKRAKKSRIFFNKKEDINKIVKMNNIDHRIKSKEYSSISKKKRDNNPFSLIINFLDDIVNKRKIQKKNITFKAYNLPLIYGKERVRMEYYLWYINKNINIKKLNDNFVKRLSLFQPYIDYLKNLDADEICDKSEFDMIFYIFIFQICEVIYPTLCPSINIPIVFNKLVPGFREFNNIDNNEYIFVSTGCYLKKLTNETYEISNSFEKKIIKEEDYNLERLSSDLKDFSFYPLNILLYKNESLKYYNCHKKCFIEREGLLTIFKDYFFDFISSKSFLDAFAPNEYKYDKIILSNKNTKNILFNENYLKIFPLLNAGYLGFTNKDLLISFIDAYPGILNYFSMNYEKDEYQDIKNFCLLMSIGEKFLTLLREHSLPFIHFYLSNKINTYEDDRMLLEKQLFGDVVKFLNTMNVITIFDGESIKKSKEKFQEIFNENFNINIIVMRVKKCSGFLKQFLEMFPIDFKTISKLQKINLVGLNTKGKYGPVIEIRKGKSSFIHTDITSRKMVIKGI